MWGSLAEWATVIVTVPTLVYALFQLKQTREAIAVSTLASRAEVRPYVWTRFQSRKSTHDQDGVSLRFENSGRTAAKNVVMRVGDGAAWKDVSVPTGFPFLAEGIRVLAPGDCLDFYVGRWGTGSELRAVADSGGTTEVVLSYVDQDGTAYEEEFVLSLRDYRGTGELKVRNTR